MTHSPHPISSLSDGDLVRRVLSGEADLFAEIVNRHQRGVWWIASITLGDRTACENLLQQAFVNAYEHLDQFRITEDLGRWLRGIARNLVRMELRWTGRQDRLLSRYHQEVLARIDDEEDDATDGDQWSQRQAMADCRQNLQPAANEALALRYEQDLSLEQVAERMGRTLGATRQLLFRTRQMLKDCIAARMANA